jgi:hypothetical protein
MALWRKTFLGMRDFSRFCPYTLNHDLPLTTLLYCPKAIMGTNEISKASPLKTIGT